MTTITETLRNAIVDCTVTDTKTGEEMTDVSACYVALVQSLQDTLPSHVTVEWGPSATRHRQAVDQAPAWVWEAALEGRLVLDGGRVAQRIVGRAAIQRDGEEPQPSGVRGPSAEEVTASIETVDEWVGALSEGSDLDRGRDDAEASRSHVDAAIEAARAGDADAVCRELHSAYLIEREWGDWPMTQAAARLLAARGWVIDVQDASIAVRS